MLSLVENSFEKNSLQDLLSSLIAAISTSERIEFITGHVFFNTAYNEIFQIYQWDFLIQCDEHGSSHEDSSTF